MKTSLQFLRGGSLDIGNSVQQFEEEEKEVDFERGQLPTPFKTD